MSTDTASVKALATKLRSLRVILGRGSPETRGWAPIVQSEIESLVAASIDLTGALAAERDALKADNANLRTVMVAAAEEIHAHWQAHCDEEGYGPANLMHRLEQGIPSQYGYTAGRFAELVAERDALARRVAELEATLALQQASYEREIRIEVEAERERCAKLCETMNPKKGTALYPFWNDCAAAIRRMPPKEPT